MDNDFIEEMEMLLRCKRYVERRVELLRKHSERMKSVGRSTESVDSEIEYLLKILNNEERS